MIQYGARVSGDGPRRWAVWIKEEDFRRELKIAFMETKEFDSAFDLVRSRLAKQVREATR